MLPPRTAVPLIVNAFKALPVPTPAEKIVLFEPLVVISV